MTPKTHKLNVHGQTVRTRTPRRFIVVAVRPKPVTVDGHTYVAFAEVIKRTDNHATAKTTMNRYGYARGAFATIIDTEEATA